MPIMAKTPDSTFTPAPEGLHLAVCVDVQDLGLVITQWGEKNKVRVTWQIEGINGETGRPYEASRSYNNSLHEKAALRKDLESWRGRKFTKVELAGFDLEQLLGVNCQLQIMHQQGDDDVLYANVETVLPAPKGQRKLVARAYARGVTLATPAPPPPGYGDFVDDLSAAAGGGQRVFDLVWSASSAAHREYLMNATPQQWDALKAKAASAKAAA